MKNFFMALIIIAIFSFINIKYQDFFNVTVTADLKTEEEKIELIEKNLKVYKNYVIVGIVTSISCLISVIGQLVFNFKSGCEFPFDLWAKGDIANALVNTVCFSIFLTLDAESVMNLETKEYYDILQGITIAISWYRFTTFLLVIESMSKLILTLI